MPSSSFSSTIDIPFNYEDETDKGLPEMRKSNSIIVSHFEKNILEKNYWKQKLIISSLGVA